MLYKFIIKIGVSPKTIRSIVHVNAGDESILVYENKTCIGIVWKHYDTKSSKAIGQAEIRFFDEYRNLYGVWHRIFVDGQRLSYEHLEQELLKNNQYNYYGEIRYTQ